MRREDLFQINFRTLRRELLPEQQILEWFDACNAYWFHDGDPGKPHAELTSGLCSNGYFNCPEVLKYPNICEALAFQLLRKMRIEYPDLGLRHPLWVVGSAYAVITFSYEVSRVIGYAMHGFVEKDPSDPKAKKMLWQRLHIPEGSWVFQAEDLITTSGTFREVRRVINEGNSAPVNFMPVVGAVVHRPPQLPVDYGDARVVALVEKAIWAVKPEDCTLCRQGSRRFRPKTHWAELTGKK